MYILNLAFAQKEKITNLSILVFFYPLLEFRETHTPLGLFVWFLTLEGTELKSVVTQQVYCVSTLVGRV